MKTFAIDKLLTIEWDNSDYDPMTQIVCGVGSALDGPANFTAICQVAMDEILCKQITLR